MTKLFIKHRYLLILLISVLISPNSYTQKEYRKHQITFYGGYGYIVGDGLPGLSNNTPDYKDKFNHSPQWDIEYFYRLDKKGVALIGFLYSGYIAKNSLANSSDKVSIQSFIPQFGFNLLQRKHFILRLSMGIGGLSFRNHSYIYKKPRRVSGSSITSNINLNFTFPISPHWSISAAVGRQMANFVSLDSRYNNETIELHKPDTNNGWFSIRKGHFNAGITRFF